MGRKRTTSVTHGTRYVAIADYLKHRIDQEVDFYNMRVRSLDDEAETVSSVAALIRTICSSYSLRFLEGWIEPYAIESESDVQFSMHIDRQSSGLWNSVIRAGGATDLHHLINLSLADYFDREDQRAILWCDRLIIIEQQLAAQDWESIKELLYVG